MCPLHEFSILEVVRNFFSDVANTRRFVPSTSSRADFGTDGEFWAL